MTSWLGKLTSPDVSPTKISDTGDRKQQQHMTKLDQGPRVPTPPGSPPFWAQGAFPRATSTSSRGSRSPTLHRNGPPSVDSGRKGRGSDVQEKSEGMTPIQQRLANLSRRLDSAAARAAESCAPAKTSPRLARAGMIGTHNNAAMTSFKTNGSADTRTTFNISMGDGDESSRGSDDLESGRFSPQSLVSQSLDHYADSRSEKSERIQRKGDKVEGKNEGMCLIVEESVNNASIINHAEDVREARGTGVGSPSNGQVVGSGNDCLSPNTDPASSMGETDNSFLTIDPLVLDEHAPDARADNAGSKNRVGHQDVLSQGGSVSDASEDDIMERSQEVRVVLENNKEDDRETLYPGASAGPHSASADDIEALRQEVR